MYWVDYSSQLEALKSLFYEVLELRDRFKHVLFSRAAPSESITIGGVRVKMGLPTMFKNGVIMDVTNVEQAKIAEDAGAVGIMVLDKLPYDVRRSGGIARMADVNVIEEVMKFITIPVSAKCRIGHYVEAKILEEIGIDLIDESEVLTPADEAHHINKWVFMTPFVNGARDLQEALRRISEGASMIRTKGEAGTGNVAEAVRHMKALNKDLITIKSHVDDEEFLRDYAREAKVPFEIVYITAKLGRVPVVNFAAGGIATPADAALMMLLGADGVFVGSGIFKSEDPVARAEAMVIATSHWDDPEAVVEAQKMVVEKKSMVGIDIKSLKPEELLQVRGV